MKKTVELMKKTWNRHDWERYKEGKPSVKGMHRNCYFIYKNKVTIRYILNATEYILWTDWKHEALKKMGINNPNFKRGVQNEK